MLPIRTSIYPRKTPYLNYGLIVINVIIFLLSMHRQFDPRAREMVLVLRPWAQQFMLFSARPEKWQFVSYAFLHSGVWHIVGNMYFLYIFGNNVNDKLGNVSYLCLYLGGAVFAGIGHAVYHVNPVLGASGAVAAVTGAYLVLFPKTVITIIYWFIFIGTMDISAWYFIAFKLIVWDNMLLPRFAPQGIAYGAHLAGYLFGIGATLLLVATGLVGRSQFDLWALMKRWHRRRVYRDTVSSGYDPFTGKLGRKKIKVKEVKKTPAQKAEEEKILELRTEITGLVNQRNLSEAAERYLGLVKMSQKQILPRQYQLDIANQLMSMSRWEDSAQAYEKFLSHYKSYEYVEQVQLMLGILYSRYLEHPAEAAQYLELAKEKLTDPGQIKMCDEELARLEKGK